MDVLHIAWAGCLLATGWFLALGTIRLLAWQGGGPDRTTGMHRLALVTLGLGVAAGLALLVLTVVIVSR